MAAQRGRAVSSDVSGADQEGCSRGPLGLGRASHHRGPMRTLPMCSAISTPLVDCVSEVTPPTYLQCETIVISYPLPWSLVSEASFIIL